MRGQGIDAGAVIDTIAVHVGVMPGALAHRAYAGHDARGDFRSNAHFAAVVEDAHHIPIFDTSLLCIHRVKPHLLATGGLEHIYVAVTGVGTGFKVETEQLQREFAALGRVPAFKG